jgi:transposase
MVEFTEMRKSKVSSAEGGLMARSGPLLTEAQWKKIAPLLPKPPKQRQGSRPWIENRRVLEGILRILRSGARWQDFPEEYPHPSTCWRQLRDWDEQGVWLNIWRAFLSELNERQQLKWSESFLNGSFAPAKKGAQESEKPSGARGRSGWWWSAARVFLWETTFTLPPRRKSGSRKRRSRRSA